MAEKRMFSKQIIDSDAFLEMPLSAQALYFHLSMRADDDGFVDNPKKIQRMVNASGDDLKLLIAKRYILTFESGVIVIKHWRIHNTLKSDRYKETVYLEEKAMLEIKPNKAYTEKKEFKTFGIPDGNQMETERNQNGTSLEPQYSIDKISIDKISIDDKQVEPIKKNKHRYGEYKNVLLTDEELEKLKSKFSDYEEKIKMLDEGIELKGYKYKSHYLAILKWAKGEKNATNKRPARTYDKKYGEVI